MHSLRTVFECQLSTFMSKTNYCYQPLSVANTQETAVKVIAWTDFIEYTCNPGLTHAVRLRLSDSLRLERFALWKPFLKLWDFGVQVSGYAGASEDR